MFFALLARPLDTASSLSSMPHGLTFCRNFGFTQIIIAGSTVRENVPLNIMEGSPAVPRP